MYLHTDQLNAPTAASDKNGVIAWRWDHDAFGVGAANQDPDGDKSLVDVQLRFPGQIEDSETGLFYNWHRYYDPTTGRYISSDPIGLNGGVNTYGYVEQSPLNFFDDDGLAKKSPRIVCIVCGGLHGGLFGPYCEWCQKKSLDPNGQVPPNPSGKCND